MSTLIRLVSAQFEAAFTCEAKRKESRPPESIRISEKQYSTQLRTPNRGEGS